MPSKPFIQVIDPRGYSNTGAKRVWLLTRRLNSGHRSISLSYLLLQPITGEFALHIAQSLVANISHRVPIL